MPDSAPHSPTPTAHALTPEQSMGRAGSVGFTFATGFRAAGRSGPCRRSTASRRAAVGWHVLSACKHEFLSPPPLAPGRAITCSLADHSLHCAKLCLSPSSCGQSSDPVSRSPPDPYLLHPCPLWCPPCTLLVDWTSSRSWPVQLSLRLFPPPPSQLSFRSGHDHVDQPLNPRFNDWSS